MDKRVNPSGGLMRLRLAGILVFLFVFATGASAGTCLDDTYVFYVNGVDNDFEEAELSRLILQAALRNHLPASCPLPRVFLNWNISTSLYGIPVADWLQAIEQFRNGVAPNDPDLLNHLSLYRAVIGAQRNVIVVGHSQGNFYANAAYDILASELGGAIDAQFAIVSVATPDLRVGFDTSSLTTPHVTLHNDPIKNVPFALDSNTDAPCAPPAESTSWDCHNFASSYLLHTAPRDRIMGLIGAAFPAQPPPTCTLSANPASIAQGQPSLLTWTTAFNPATATIDQGVGTAAPGGGSVTVVPVATTVYTLTVSNLSGSSVCSATVNVANQPPPPPPGTFVLTPADVLRVSFTTNPSTFGAHLPNEIVLWFSRTCCPTVPGEFAATGITSFGAALYDGTTVLGSHSRSGTLSGSFPNGLFISSDNTNPLGFGQAVPTVVDFTAIRSGTISGTLEFSIDSGTLTFPGIMLILGDTVNQGTFDGRWVDLSFEILPRPQGPSQISTISSPFVHTPGNGPKAVADHFGNVTVVWGSLQGIRASRYDAVSQTWSTETQLSGLPEVGFLNFDIAAAPGGDVLVAWTELLDIPNQGQRRLQWTRLVHGTQLWTPPEVLPFPTLPRFAMDANGNVIAVWYLSGFASIGSFGVWTVQTARWSAVTRQWDSPTDLSGPSAIWQDVGAHPLALSHDTRGNLIAVWAQGVAQDRFVIQGARYSHASATWSVPTTVSQTFAAPGPFQPPSAPLAVLDQFGNATAAWGTYTGELQATRCDASTGVWTVPHTFAAPGATMYGPSMAAADNGDVMLSWIADFGTPETLLLASRFAVVSGSWDAPVTVETGVGALGRQPSQTSFDSGGHALVVWEDAAALGGVSPYEVHATRFSGVSWASPSLLSSPGRSSFAPVLVTDNNGHWIVVWQATAGVIFEAVIQAVSVPQ